MTSSLPISTNDQLDLSSARKRLWSLSWPAMISGLSVPLLGLVDTSIVGRVGTAEALGSRLAASKGRDQGAG